jgi:diguanylate cyclase (GGDEF)-like protein
MADIVDNATRQGELERYATLDALGDGAFDDITALVARFFRMPIAIVSLVHGDRVWFKSAYGLGDVRQAGRDPGLCRSAIMADEAGVGSGSGPGALTNPLVANDNGFRFSASAPLRSLHGHHLGALCIVDTVPRAFSREDAQMLARFGRLVMVQMEQRLASREIADLIQQRGVTNPGSNRTATHDVRTGLLNRGAILSDLRELCGQADNDQPFATLLFDVDHLQTVNDIYGQSGGDAVVTEVARRIKAAVRAGDHVGRFGGDEFLVLLPECDKRACAGISERVRQAVERTPVRYGGRDVCITISAGVCLTRGKAMALTEADGGKVETETVLKAADDALYAAKRAGRNRVVFSRTHDDVVTASA